MGLIIKKFVLSYKLNQIFLDKHHLFFEGKGEITPAEYQKTGHVAECVIGDIVEWMKRVKNE